MTNTNGAQAMQKPTATLSHDQIDLLREYFEQRKLWFEVACCYRAIGVEDPREEGLDAEVSACWRLILIDQNGWDQEDALEFCGNEWHRLGLRSAA